MRTRTIEIAGRTVAYSVHASGKAKRLSLRLSPRSGLVFVVPKRWRADTIDFDALLSARVNWIVRALDRLASLERRAPKISFADGSKFRLLGKEITLRVEQSAKKRTAVRIIGDELQVKTSNPASEHVRDAVVAWFKHAARQIIPVRVNQLNSAAGFTVTSVIVRDQKSRWGSCSRRGTLSFNWRLLLVPETVMDYLIYHELAHLQEMNHSINFWRVVGKLCPAYDESERWLKSEGPAMFW